MIIILFHLIVKSISREKEQLSSISVNANTSYHFITITNNFSISDYRLFSLERSGSYEEISNQRSITANYAFTVNLYMKSTFCPNYTLIGSINSTPNSTNDNIIQDSDAPSSCQSPFTNFLTITNNFTEINEYQLYYQSNFGRYTKINDEYSKQDKEQFSIDLYVSSKKCPTYTFLITVNSTSEESYEKVVQDSDMPSECTTGYTSFIRIKNNFTVDDYVLYYSNSTGVYKKIDGYVILRANSSFTIGLYMTSTFCTDLTYVCSVNSSSDMYYEFVIDDSNAPQMCQSFYNNFLTIINNFTVSDYHLYYLSKSGKYEEIGFRYFEQSNSSFQIQLYMTSYRCQQYNLVATIESSTEKDFEKVVQNSDAPANCQPTYYIALKNEFSRTDFHLYYLASNEEYEEVLSDVVTLKKNEQFSIDLYMTSPFCTTYNYICSLNSTLDEGFINEINDSYAPLNCQYQSEYFLTVVNGFTTNDYHLFYRSEDSADYVAIENSLFFSYPLSFTVDLYLTSEKCPQYRFIDKVRSSTNKSYEKVVENADVPENCQQSKYFITITNNFTYPDYLLYYSLDKRRYIEIENVTSIDDLNQFTVYLYMKSNLCSKYSLIDQYDSSVDKLYTLEITDDDAPESCQSPYKYFVAIKNNFTLSDFHLFYLEDENDTEFKEIESSLLLEKTINFSIDLYMKSDYCQDYTYISTAESVESRLDETVINNFDAPENCSIYEICFSLDNLSLNYSIGFMSSFDDENEVINASRGTNIVRSNSNFSITAYLLSSPKCVEQVELNEIESDIDSTCFVFNDDLIPDSCKDGSDDDSGSGTKKSKVPLIAGLSCAAVVVVAASVVGTVFYIKKRKNADLLNGNNEGLVNSNQDAIYTNINP